ncbi:type I restriction modification DNA specificity domain protein [Halomonas elongata]|uniref:Type I restriction modification DNA specificity domain protein n=1 Tax=Halomonas elongata TaxID=2746 RepID=A0A1B8NYU1_HALEL|nr:type I restriction modification DNA specificity domain protein [Halomonas elongata]
MIRPFELKELSKKQAARSPEYLLKEGEVLVSTDGTVGRVDLVSQRREGWFASNNLARIDSSNVDNGFLYVFLSTEYGKHQICKEIYGGVIDHINEKQLGSVLIPMLPETVQKSIGNKARKAALLRDEAAEIESIAVQKIEKVILESSKT